MVLPEQLHHENPTEDGVRVDIIRSRGSLARYCQNAETQVNLISQATSNCRKSCTGVKTWVRPLFSAMEDTAQLSATRTRARPLPATLTCICTIATRRKAPKST